VPDVVLAVVDIVRVDEPKEPGVIGTESGLIVMPGICVPDGVTLAESATLPVMPRLFRLIEDVAELPATKTDGVALVAEIVKSPWMVICTLTEWV
jgi:hypothetical protein